MPNGDTLIDTQFDLNLEVDCQHEQKRLSEIKAVTLPRPDLWVKLSKPKPTEVFETYWKFASLRQNVFFARVLDRPELDPRDPIIARHRFTNAYRASDRVSQYLIKNIIYDGNNWSREDTFFRILLFKIFNKIDTWETLQSRFGEVTWDSYSYEEFNAILSKLMDQGKTIYSAAYIMPSGRSAYGYAKKHQNHLKLIEAMMAARLPERICQQPDLEAVYRLLREFPCIGPFTGYQYTIDLNYSELVDFSENSFVEAGPGALDGIKKCFSDIGDYTPAEVIKYMKDVQQDAFATFEVEFKDLWGRPLHLIDCQNLFCEVDKYARVAHPHISGKSGRTRIKQSYKKSPRLTELPFYPPKWGINDAIILTV